MTRRTLTNIRELIEKNRDRLAQRHGFDERKGWDQVRGKPIDVVVEYGKFDAYCDLIEDLQ